MNYSYPELGYLITPIDVIKGISGKYGNGSNDYFATNSSSNCIHLAKLFNPYTNIGLSSWLSA